MEKSPVRIERLEQALAHWEEMMWSAGIERQFFSKTSNTELLKQCLPLTGPVVHHKELRRHLLTIRSMDQFDHDRFLLPTLDSKAQVEAAGNSVSFAEQLAWWTVSSRRVYHVDPNLQALLGATKLDKLKMGDIIFPFESFCVGLSDPLIDEGESFDLLLFSPVHFYMNGVRHKFLSLVMFSRAYDKWKPLPHRDRLVKMIARGQYHEAGVLVRKHGRTFARQHYSKQIVVKPGDHEINYLLDAFSTDEWTGVRQAWRILFGLTMYLKMLPTNSPYIGEWRPPHNKKIPLSLDHRAITDESLICSVASTRRLSEEERTLMNLFSSGRASGYEMSVHFRNGHWRRPPGTGHDTQQEKTVLVHPTIVRLDRLPEGAVPAGSLVSLP